MNDRTLEKDEPPEKPKIIYLIPCSGNSQLGKKPNHVYRAQTKDQVKNGVHGDNLGYFDTIEAAQEQFGAENVKASGSHGLCPDCYAFLMSDE